MAKEIFDAIIVGGGASGLMTAITAAKNGCRVLILEQKSECGKKINATGNGKCNFTNRDWKKAYFRGNQPELAMQVLAKFPLEETLSFFHAIGIFPKERNGYFYPQSEQASSVSKALIAAAKRYGCNILCDKRVTKVSKTLSGIFQVFCDKEIFNAKCVVLSAGGMASPCHGSDGSGFVLAKELGHHLAAPVPAIVQLKAEGAFFKTLSGVRTEGKVTLRISSKQKEFGESYEEQGELLFAAYGISGIPVMQVSRYASVALSEGKKVEAELDFMMNFSETQLEDELKDRFSHLSGQTTEDALMGLCNSKLNYVICNLAKVNPTKDSSLVSQEEIQRLLKLYKHFTIRITDTNGFENAQACAGGVLLSELSSDLESKFVPGLYFTGEITDVDGTCGGYNLQWAWSSGFTVGKNIGERYASNSTAKASAQA